MGPLQASTGKHVYSNCVPDGSTPCIHEETDKNYIHTADHNPAIMYL